MLRKAVKPLVRKQDVIQYLYPQDVTGDLDPVRDVQVLGAGDELAGGMVVGEDDGRGPFDDGIGKDLAGVYVTLIDETDGHHPRAHYLVGAVEGDDDEVLLLAVGVVLNQRQDVRRVFDPDTFRPDPPTHKLEGRGDQGSLGRAHALDIQEVGGGDVDTLSVDDRDDPAGQGHYVMFLRAPSQNDGEQILIGQGTRAQLNEPLTRALLLG